MNGDVYFNYSKVEGVAKLNLETLQSMSDSELNELSAVKVMGYTMYHYNKDIEENCYYLLMNGLDAVNPLSHGYNTEEEAWRDWNPTSDMNDAMELETKIINERANGRLIYIWYIDLLGKVVGIENVKEIYGYSQLRDLIHATPRQRTIASIRALE